MNNNLFNKALILNKLIRNIYISIIHITKMVR